MTMFLRRATMRFAGLAAALSLAVAACGGDDGDADAAAAGARESTTATAQSQDEEAEAESASGGEESGAAAGGDWPDKLVFAAVPAESNVRLQEGYQPIIDRIEDNTGIEVEFFQAADYAGVIEAIIAGNVDLAQFGPFSYVIATINGAEIEPIGAMVDAPDAVPGYRSYAITQGDNSEINTLADFAGKNICFVDPGSTSGYLYPSAGLLSEGIDPEADVNGVFAGGHDASALKVASGECDAGFAFDSMVDSVLIESGDLAEGDLKVVWKSEVIAGSPLVVRTELPQDLRDELERIALEEANVDFLVAIGECASVDDCKLSDEEIWGYKEVDDAFYDGVRAVCDVTRSEKCSG